MKTDNSPKSCVTLEENMKKALTELLLLHLLNKREYFIGELTQALNVQSGGALKLSFPYSAVYRLQQDGHISEGEKKVASDGRRRQFYCITQPGREYYHQLLSRYHKFIDGIDTLLNHSASN